MYDMLRSVRTVKSNSPERDGGGAERFAGTRRWDAAVVRRIEAGHGEGGMEEGRGGGAACRSVSRPI